MGRAVPGQGITLEVVIVSLFYRVASPAPWRAGWRPWRRAVQALSRCGLCDNALVYTSGPGVAECVKLSGSMFRLRRRKALHDQLKFIAVET